MICSASRLGWIAVALFAVSFAASAVRGDVTSDIIHQMTYGTRPSSGPPVVDPGVPDPPANPPSHRPPHRPGCNIPIVTVPGWGWGWGGGDYGYNYQQGYYVGSLEAENQYLRDQLMRDELDRQRQQAEAEAAENQQRIDDARRARQEKADRAKAETATRSGIRLLKKGSAQQAAQRFRQAAELDPNDSAPAFYLAQSLFAAGQYAPAAAAIREGLVRSPQWPMAQMDFRFLYADQGDLLTQMGALARHLKGNPLDADAMYVLGFVLFVTGEEEKAKTIFEQVGRISPAEETLRPFLDAVASAPRSEPLAQAGPPPAGDVPGTPAPPIPLPGLLEQHLRQAGEGTN